MGLLHTTSKNANGHARWHILCQYLELQMHTSLHPATALAAIQLEASMHTRSPYKNVTPVCKSQTENNLIIIRKGTDQVVVWSPPQKYNT